MIFDPESTSIWSSLILFGTICAAIGLFMQQSIIQKRSERITKEAINDRQAIISSITSANTQVEQIVSSFRASTDSILKDIESSSKEIVTTIEALKSNLEEIKNSQSSEFLKTQTRIGNFHQISTIEFDFYKETFPEIFNEILVSESYTKNLKSIYKESEFNDYAIHIDSDRIPDHIYSTLTSKIQSIDFFVINELAGSDLGQSQLLLTISIPVKGNVGSTSFHFSKKKNTEAEYFSISLNLSNIDLIDIRKGKVPLSMVDLCDKPIVSRVIFEDGVRQAHPYNFTTGYVRWNDELNNEFCFYPSRNILLTNSTMPTRKWKMKEVLYTKGRMACFQQPIKLYIGDTAPPTPTPTPTPLRKIK